MKYIKTLLYSFAVNFIICIAIILCSVNFAAYSDVNRQKQLKTEFDERLNTLIKSAPAFNKKDAEQQALKKLELTTIPEKVPSPSNPKFYNFISKKAIKQAKKKFTKKMRSKIILKAMKKFKYYEVGDRVSVDVISGGRKIKHTGIFKGFVGETVFIGDKKLSSKAISPASLQRLKKLLMEKKQKEYIRKHFDIPRSRYINKLKKKLRKKYKEKAKIYMEFVNLVKKKESEYPHIVRRQCVKNALTEFMKYAENKINNKNEVEEKIAFIEDVLAAVKKVMKEQRLRYNVDTESILEDNKPYENAKLQLIMLRESSQGTETAAGKIEPKKMLISAKQLAKTIDMVFAKNLSGSERKQWRLIYDNILRGQYVIARRLLAGFQFSQQLEGKFKTEINKLIYKLNGADRIHNKRTVYEIMSMYKLIKYINDFLIPGQYTEVENFYRFARAYVVEKNFIIAKSMIKKAYKRADGDCKTALDVLYDKCSLKVKEQRHKKQNRPKIF